MAPSVDPYDELLGHVNDHFKGNRALALKAQGAMVTTEAWLSKFRTEYSGSPALRLAEAGHSAAVEVVSAVSLGLARPAVFSLRSHFELFLMFLFYKDHLKELRAADEDMEFMKLPGEITKYLKRYCPDYENRLKVLDLRKTRPKEPGAYHRLSAIVHGSSQTAAPSAGLPKDVCFEPKTLEPLVALVADICEELSDIAVSAHEGNWLSLPTVVQQSLAARGADADLKGM